MEDHVYKAKYRAYLSEQVVDESQPNTLLLAHIDVMRPHISSCEAVSNWQEKSTSPNISIIKTIFHPGEVNKIRELPQHPHVVVTHTDSELLHVWNMERQPDRRPTGGAEKSTKSRKSTSSSSASTRDAAPSVADLVLAGHTDEALFPLACSAGDPRVASGGNDQLVLLWDLADSVASLTAAAPEGAGRKGQHKEAPRLMARYKMVGHTATIGDVVFQPSSPHVLISVADDGCVITWDVRQKGNGGGKGGKGGKDKGDPSEAIGPAATLAAAHGPGVNVMCVDWSALDENMVVTGASDGSLRVWDRRRMGSPAEAVTRLQHYGPGGSASGSNARDIIHVEWHPTDKNVFASGSEDHTVMIWNLNPDRIDYKTGRPIAPQPAAEPAAAGAAETGSAAAGKPQQDQQQSGEAAAPPAAEGADKAAAGGEPAAMEVDTTGAGKAGEGEDGQKQAEGAEKAAAGDGEEGKGKEAEGKEGKGGEGGAEEAGASKKRGRDGAAKDGAEKAGAGKGAGGGGGDGAEGDPPELIFKHIGHRFGRVTDFQWLPGEPWTVISVSDNSGVADDVADGSLQLWRINDLIYRPYEEALRQLEEHGHFILTGKLEGSGETKAKVKGEGAKGASKEEAKGKAEGKAEDKAEGENGEKEADKEGAREEGKGQSGEVGKQEGKEEGKEESKGDQPMEEAGEEAGAKVKEEGAAH